MALVALTLNHGVCKLTSIHRASLVTVYLHVRAAFLTETFSLLFLNSLLKTQAKENSDENGSKTAIHDFGCPATDW